MPHPAPPWFSASRHCRFGHSTTTRPRSRPHRPQTTPVTPPPAARILTFGAAPDHIDPGDPVTLSWSVAGDRAELCALPPIGGTQPTACQTVPVSSTLTLISSNRQRYWARFSLRAIDDAQPTDALPYAELAVAVSCPDQWLTAGPPAGVGE